MSDIARGKDAPPPKEGPDYSKLFPFSKASSNAAFQEMATYGNVPPAIRRFEASNSNGFQAVRQITTHLPEELLEAYYLGSAINFAALEGSSRERSIVLPSFTPEFIKAYVDRKADFIKKLGRRTSGLGEEDNSLRLLEPEFWKDIEKNLLGYEGPMTQAAKSGLIFSYFMYRDGVSSPANIESSGLVLPPSPLSLGQKMN